MEWRSMLELLLFCVRLVVRAAVIMLTFGCFLLIGVGFDWMIKWTLGVLEASEYVRNVFSQVTLMYIFLIATAATLSSTAMVAYLTFADMGDILREVIERRKGSEDRVE